MAEQDFAVQVGKYLDPKPEIETVLVECPPEAVAEIEAATYANVNDFRIGYSKAKRNGFIDEIDMTVKGSAVVVNGPYAFNTAIKLRRKVPGLITLLDTMQEQMQGRPVLVEKSEEDIAFVIIDTNGYASCIGYEVEEGIIYVSSCDVEQPGKDAIPEADLGALRHGTHVFHESFATHLEVVGNLLDQVHTLRSKPTKPTTLIVHARQPVSVPGPQAAENEKDGSDEPSIIERAYPKLEDFVGFDAQVRKVGEVIAEMQDPDLLRGWGIERRGSILIHGGKDSGATMLVSAICNELGVEPVCPDYNYLQGEKVGQSEHLLAEYLEPFRYVDKPTVLVLPNIDTFLAGSTIHLRMGLIIDNFLKELPYLPNVLLVATRNPSRSMSGGFNELHSFGLEVDLSKPDQDTRKAVIARVIDKYFSQGDIAHMFSTEVLTRIWEADDFAKAAEDMPVGSIDVTIQDLIRARVHRYAAARRPKILAYGHGETKVTASDQIGVFDILQALKTANERYT